MSHAPQRPTARFFIACADAVLAGPSSGDLTAGWWEVINPFHTVWMPPGIERRFAVTRMTVYLQLTDGVGPFSLGIVGEQLDLANPRRNRVVVRSDPIQVTFSDPWEVIEEVVDLVGVGFPLPGLYRFQLREGGQEIEGGTTYLRVMPGEKP